MQIEDELCPIGFCNGSRPFCHGTKCVPACPFDYFNYNYYCVRNCFDDQPYSADKNCTSQCPLAKPFLVEKRCVQLCPTDLLIFNNSCVSECPKDHPLIFDNNCVSRCPDNQYVIDDSNCVKSCPFDKQLLIYNNTCVFSCLSGYKTFNKTCVQSCPIGHQYQLNETISTPGRWGSKTQITRCVNECPTTTAVSTTNDGFECKFTCPKYHVLFNRSCVDQCPASHRYIVQHISNYMHHTMVMCVAECPSGFLLDDRSCEKRCPDDKFVENNTCSFQCSNDTLLCDWTQWQCFHNKNNLGIKHCLIECPKDHAIHESTCYRHCYQTPHKYRLDGLCVDACPSNFSLTYGENCVQNCPENYVVFEGSCSWTCPQNTILVNKTCHKTCPSAVPYKNVYYTKEWHYRWPYYREKKHTECVRHCPEEKLYSHKECVLTCANRLMFNRSCTDSCPESHLYHYTTSYKNTTTCVDQIPEGSVILNGTYFDRCPDNYWTVEQSRCYSECPASYPFQFTEYLYISDKGTNMCVDVCPYGTLVLNGSCASSCPKDNFLYNGGCVESCPFDYPYVLKTHRFGRRKVFLRPYYFKEEAQFCISECFVSFRHYPCIIFTERVNFLVNGSCDNWIERILSSGVGGLQSINTCDVSRVYNISGLFVLNCPNDKFHDEKICVESCSTDRPLFHPSNRICVDRCPSPLLTYKNNCLSSCPDKTYVYKLQCVTLCPGDMRYRLKGSEGTYCLHECPHKYFIDGPMCINKCPKKIFGMNCVPKCPSTHPFEDDDYEGDTKIYTCYDYCPDSKIGNTTTFKCTYSCEGYRYDKKCYTKCPPGTFNFTHDLSYQKNCADKSVQKIIIGICISILLAMIAFIFWCCTEKTMFSGSPQTSQTEVNYIHLSFVSLNSSFHNVNER